MDLQELTESLREEKIPRIKAALKGGREGVLEEFRSGNISGPELIRALSDLTDRQVEVFAEHYLGAYKDEIALAFTGGNGRREVYPCSDLDILVLVPKKLPEGFEEAYTKFSYALTDAGFNKPGLSARTPAECRELAKKDITIWTSLIDRRYLWGRREFFTALEKAMAGLQKEGGDFFDGKQKEREGRLNKMGDSRYMLHPNIKEGKGGLRDYQTVLWIAGAVFGCGSLECLVEKGLLSNEERKRIGAAHDFLITARSHLHTVLNRPEEVLAAEYLPDIVASYNASRPGSEPESVESFMRRYFHHAREIGFFTNIVAAAIEESNAGIKKWIGQRWREENGFEIRGLHIRFKKDAPYDAAAMIGIFHEAAARGLTLHHTALKEIRENAASIADAREDAEVNGMFLSMLCDKKDNSRLLRQMQETGFLQHFIPAFAHIDMLMQFDPYHEFTVDEHIFNCVSKMQGLESGSISYPLANRLFKEMNEPERRVLYTAIFLHDVCKGLGGRHEELGADYALRICPRLGLNDEETQAVSWLVRQHLLLSQTAFHRDADDPATIRDFTAAIPSERHLDMLAILTAADIMGVGPGRWNWNKAASIEQLYGNAQFFMRERELKSASGTVLPEGYRNGETVIDIRNDNARHVTVISVFTPDRSRLFEKLTGVMGLGGGNIVDAKIQTAGNIAADSFTVRNSGGNPYSEDDFGRLRDKIMAALENKTDIGKELERVKASPRYRAAYPLELAIKFNNAASAHNTVLEIEAHDRPKLLYELARIFNELELDLRRAKITVYGHKAADTFYLRDRETGGKIGEERFESIRAAIAASPAFAAR